jgi:hypothetical protein
MYTKIGNFTSENNPYHRALRVVPPDLDTWTKAWDSEARDPEAPDSEAWDPEAWDPEAWDPETESPAAWPAPGRPGIAGFFILAAGIMADCLAAWPRRMCDRLFAINDAEAYWRGWQITRVHGGLGRRYRDPAFDTLLACADCQGIGIQQNAQCDYCLGTGRLTIAGDAGGVS